MKNVDIIFLMSILNNFHEKDKKYLEIYMPNMFKKC